LTSFEEEDKKRRRGRGFEEIEGLNL